MLVKSEKRDNTELYLLQRSRRSFLSFRFWVLIFPFVWLLGISKIVTTSRSYRKMELIFILFSQNNVVKLQQS